VNTVGRQEPGPESEASQEREHGDKKVEWGWLGLRTRGNAETEVHVYRKVRGPVAHTCVVACGDKAAASESIPHCRDGGERSPPGVCPRLLRAVLSD
jgi:hypothetical protein